MYIQIDLFDQTTRAPLLSPQELAALLFDSAICDPLNGEAHERCMLPAGVRVSDRVTQAVGGLVTGA